jgi:hypothetical protein
VNVSDVQVRFGISMHAFGDAMLDMGDSLRTMQGYPPATKGLGYWQRRERRAIERASLRGRVQRLWSALLAVATEIGRRLINARRALAGEWSSDELS